jgi:hypothetical protein
MKQRVDGRGLEEGVVGASLLAEVLLLRYSTCSAPTSAVSIGIGASRFGS